MIVHTVQSAVGRPLLTVEAVPPGGVRVSLVYDDTHLSATIADYEAMELADALRKAAFLA